MLTPPESQQRYLTLAAVATGYFAVQLSLPPISAILPSLARALGADLATAGWIIIGFLLTLSAFLLLAGRLGDLLGHRVLFLGGGVLFTVASLLCGLAGSATQLIAFRGLQGLGGAFVTANSLPLVTAAFREGERGRAVGVVAMAASAGGFLGIILSAIFLRYLSWRSAFYLPGLTAAVSIGLLLGVRQERRATAPRVVDWAGAGCLFALMLSLFLGMNHYHGNGDDEGYHAVFLGLFGLLSLALYWIERRHPCPLIDFRHFAHLPFAASITANGIFHMTMMAVMFLVPFLVERVIGLTPFYTAVALSSTFLPATLIAVLGGWLHDRYGSSWQRAGSMAVIGLGLATLAAVGTDYWFLVSVVGGVGVVTGLFLSANNTVVMSSLPADLRGFASGMLETTRQLGHGLAVSVASAVIGASLPGASLVAGTPSPFVLGFQTTTLVMAALALLGSLPSLVGPRAPRLSEVPAERA